MLLIFGHNLRSIPYSDEEAEVGQKLINLYYNFAKYNSVVYENVKLEQSTPEVVKTLEITRTVDVINLAEDFGKPLFWDDVDKILSSKEITFFDSVPGDHDEL